MTHMFKLLLIRLLMPLPQPQFLAWRSAVCVQCYMIDLALKEDSPLRITAVQVVTAHPDCHHILCNPWHLAGWFVCIKQHTKFLTALYSEMP